MELPYQKLELADRTLAYCQDSIGETGVLFLSGFFSDMTGTKASFLAEKCKGAGLGFTRFDYRGHGLSSGTFKDYCIGDWLDDALQVFDACTKGPQILVGSSMGGWIMLLLALKRPERVKALVGIAAAPDFTEDLVWDKLSEAEKQELQSNGVIYEPSPYGDPLPYTRKLVEEGRSHLLLRKQIPINVPVRLLQGVKDDDVPWQTALKISEQMQSDNVRVTLVKDGDHRLSHSQDLDLLWQEVQSCASASI